MEFRKQHFESMLRWPSDDERIRVFKYEDIVGNEKRVFREMFSHYTLSVPEQILGGIMASHFRVEQTKDRRHVRDPSPGQWQKVFTATATEEFEKRFPGLVQGLGYEGNQTGTVAGRAQRRSEE
jgi:hypothetical protein